jgi:predicted nucleotide-binding protein
MIALIFAKLAGLRKSASGWIAQPQSRYFDPAEVLEYFNAYAGLSARLRDELPELYGDLPERQNPPVKATTDYEGRGYVERQHLERLVRDIDYVFEVRANSELSAPAEQQSREHRVFLSHGRAPDWREVQAYIERDLGVPTLELAQQPNLGRTILQKLAEESDQCSYAVIVMTGDDQVAAGAPRARENVIHEIGYFQGRYGLANVCLLHEEGTSIPSNVHGVVYIPFPKGMVSAAFGILTRELSAAFGRR